MAILLYRGSSQKKKNIYTQCARILLGEEHA